MALKTLVKVGSVTNLGDARYCAGMDVQMLGFQAIPGLPRHIPVARYQEIRGWVTGPKIVVELYGIENEEQLASLLETYRPDYVELGMSELHRLEKLALPLVLRLHPNDAWTDDMDAKATVAYVMVDAGDHRHFPVPKLAIISSEEEAREVITQRDVGGISMLGSDELSPGLNTYDTLAPVLELLEEE